jgi:diacylglycerol O-acyltransferase / wax synthase
MSSLTASDAAWFRMDRQGNAADIVVLLSLDGAVGLDEVRRLLQERLLRIERFRRRVVPRPLGPPAWEIDPAFSLERHVVGARIAPGGLRELVGEVATAPLDPAHPPWRIVVVEEPGAGGALVGQLHHALGDGFAMIGVLQAIADEQSGRAPRHPGVRDRPSGVVSLARRAAGMSLALARLVALRSDPPDLAAAALSGVRRVAWSSGLRVAEVQAAARLRGATTNDLVVAAVSGALRAHLLATGRTPDARRHAFIPVNLRRSAPDPASDGALGNRFGLVFLDLPLHLPAAEQRLAAVRAAGAAFRGGVEALATQLALAACGYLPTPAHHALTSFFARKASIVLTNVPGPRRPVTFAGRTVTRAMFWVPHPANLGLGVSVLSYAGELTIGVRADAAVLPDPAALVTAVEAELAAYGVAPGPAGEAAP